MRAYWDTSAELRLTRKITDRGVLWLGLKCDVRCKFCYDELMPAGKKVWLSVEEVTEALTKFKNYYGNEHVDFMGGEPTLHPQIIEILQSCGRIGIRPTIITHGMHLSNEEKLLKFKEAGVFDFLVSVHGIGKNVQKIHSAGHNNFERQVLALENMRKHNIPFRFNCTMIKDNIEQLPDIARLAREYGARVVNFLTFNPYFEWSHKPEIEFQAQHSEIAPKLMEAIDICEASDIEANVRYMPICCLPGYEKNVFTGFQLPYDEHEWDYNSWYDMGDTPSDKASWYWEAAKIQQERHDYCHVKACSDCAVQSICDGFHKQYLERFGEEEAQGVQVPSNEEEIKPDLYVQHQKKWSYRSSQRLVSSVQPNAVNPPLTATQFADKKQHRAGVRKT